MEDSEKKSFLIIDKIPVKRGIWKNIDKIDIKNGIYKNFEILVNINDIHWCLSSHNSVDGEFRSCGIYINDFDRINIFNKIKKGKRLTIEIENKTWSCFIESNQQIKKQIERINSKDNLESLACKFEPLNIHDKKVESLNVLDINDKKVEPLDIVNIKDNMFEPINVNNDWESAFIQLWQFMENNHQTKFIEFLHDDVLDKFLKSIIIDEVKKIKPDINPANFTLEEIDKMYSSAFFPTYPVLSPTSQIK